MSSCPVISIIIIIIVTTTIITIIIIIIAMTRVIFIELRNNLVRTSAPGT